MKESFRFARVYVTTFDEQFGYLRPERNEHGNLDYSEETLRLLDQAVIQFMEKCQERSHQLVLDSKEIIISIQQRLLREETIDNISTEDLQLSQCNKNL